MPSDRAVPLAPTANRSLLFARIATFLRLAGALAALVYFAVHFQPYSNQYAVDSLWILGLCLWGWEIRVRSGGRLLGVRPQQRDVLTMILLLEIFAAAWLPFRDNWRWVFTGDSFGGFGTAYNYATRPLEANLLSFHGIDNAFPVLGVYVYALPMLLFGPTLFWQRVGQLLIDGLALTTIYAFYVMVWGRWWSTAVVIGTAINYVFLFYSYVTYFKTDSYIFYYLTLIFGTLIWRSPDRLGLWLLCGVTGGLSIFFTPTAWSAVALVNLLAGLGALRTRRIAALAVLVLSFLFGALPALLDIGMMFGAARQQSGPLPDWHYVYKIASAVILLPYASGIYGLGVQGAFLPRPFGYAYLAGLGVALLAVLPPLRRLLRVPAITPVLLGVLLWDALLLALTNKGYGDPSPKRAYNFIPLEVFFALLPAYMIWAWGAAYKWWRRAMAVPVVAALVVYAALNLRLIMFPAFRMYGHNRSDALVELRQRFPDRRKLFLTSYSLPIVGLDPSDLLNVTYKIWGGLTMESGSFTDATLERACNEHLMLCYEYALDHEQMEPLLQKFRRAYEPVELLNSTEVRCYDCVAPPSRPHERVANPAEVGITGRP